jgi:hypothetical protein
VIAGVQKGMLFCLFPGEKFVFFGVKHTTYCKKHPHVVLPADTDHAGEPVHRAGGAEYYGSGGLRDL